MGMGPQPLGYLAFAGVKLAGYTAAGAVLRRKYDAQFLSALDLGAARTAIGVAVGLSYGAAWSLFAHFSTGSIAPLFFLLLLPVRLAEWAFLVWWLLDRPLVRRDLLSQTVGLGTCWSFALDALGLSFAFVIPGGFWVC